ncbi:hypothetical protein AB1Y20_008433 [Prymnesium parvum]|uniref:non-specific serine/threonine protein kinase n=1 Tax=Prymnesium parvum TaxID=97485 RepID=A0AB34ITV1_PRYPA
MAALPDDDGFDCSDALSSPSRSSTSAVLDSQPVDYARHKLWDRLLQRVCKPSCSFDACDPLGRTALHYAAGYGHQAAVHALLAGRASVQATDRFGATPLHWATLKAEPDVIEALLGAGADALQPATAGRLKGRSALDVAAPAVRDKLVEALGHTLFEQRKVLGRGGYGTVWKAVRLDTGATVALKAVSKTIHSVHAGLQAARVERDVLAKLDHPFVIRMHSAFQTHQHLYMALDYCGGGDLAVHVRHATGGRLTEETATFVASELLLALEYLHEHGVIHRDVKLENVLIDAQGHVRLADLNVAKQDIELAMGGRTYTVVGTPFSTAPEVLLSKGYSVAADWWSFGVVLFEMIAGVPPYPKDPALMTAQARLVHEILYGERALLPETASVSARTLLSGLLDRDEARRLSRPSELRSHAFFAEVRWGALLAKQVESPLLFLPSARALSRAKEQLGLDVFDYPSVLPTESRDGGWGEGGVLRGESHGTSGVLPDWDYVAAHVKHGERLWRRVRANMDMQARLLGISRLEYIIYVLITIAANEATGVGISCVEL